jgi:hypothetical protein
MKAFIGGIIGALLMAGVLLFMNGQTPALQAAGSYAPALTATAPMAPAMVQVPLAQAQAAGLVPMTPQYAMVSSGPGLVPAVQAYAPAQPVVERVVYRDAPVTRSVRRTSTTRYRQPVREGRSWKKSALIIGGSAAGGAGLGAIVDGKGGAKKGAIIGGVGGLVYDLATRHK